MAQETLREAVARAICMTLYGEEIRDALLISPLERSECFDSADAAIATMFERLRTPSDDIIAAGCEEVVLRLEVSPARIWQSMLTAFQQENSEATTYKEIRALLEAAKCKACCGLGLSEMEFERN